MNFGEKSMLVRHDKAVSALKERVDLAIQRIDNLIDVVGDRLNALDQGQSTMNNRLDALAEALDALANRSKGRPSIEQQERLQSLIEKARSHGAHH